MRACGGANGLIMEPALHPDTLIARQTPFYLPSAATKARLSGNGVTVGAEEEIVPSSGVYPLCSPPDSEKRMDLESVED